MGGDELVSLHLVTAAEQRRSSWLLKALDASANVELSSNEMFGASRRISLFVRWRKASAHAHANAQGSPEATQAYHQRGDRRPKACLCP
jgi:hypothetical protein